MCVFGRGLGGCVSTCVLSCVQLFVTPWTVARQAPPSMGFSRQEYWSGMPLPSPKKSQIDALYLFPPTLIIFLLWKKEVRKNGGNSKARIEICECKYLRPL